MDTDVEELQRQLEEEANRGETEAPAPEKTSEKKTRRKKKAARKAKGVAEVEKEEKKQESKPLDIAVNEDTVTEDLD